MGFVPNDAIENEHDQEGLSCAAEQGDEKRFLTKWRLRSGAQGDEASAKEIRIDYKCCSYGPSDVKLEQCSWWCAPGGPIENGPGFDPRTSTCQGDISHPAVESHGSLMALLHPWLAVDCPPAQSLGVTALVSWFMEKSTATEDGGAIRLRFYCCAMPVKGEVQFLGEAMQVETDAQYKDDKISSLTAHNVECPAGTVMSGWRMEETKNDANKFHIIATCQKLDNMPEIGATDTCEWVGDPHYLCFGKECDHDPMTPTAGFYWVVKNDIVQVQGYYQGKEAGQPMRTSGVAFGGKFLSGCKVVVKMKTNRLEGLTNIAVNDGDPVMKVVVCFCKGACTTDHCKIDGDYAETFDCGTQTDSEEKIAATIITKTGRQTEVLMPMEVRYKVTHHSSWMDNWITMFKMPGAFDGQCGNWNGNTVDDANKGHADEFQMSVDELETTSLFFGDYTGHLGIGGKTGEGQISSLEECPPATLKEANAVCNMLFPPVIDPTEAAHMKVFHRICLLDECNTGGADSKAEIANADKTASEIDELNIDDAKPRIYIPTPSDTDQSKTSPVLCKKLYGADSMLAKPTTEWENDVILEAANDYAGKTVASEKVVSTACLKIGIWKNGPADNKKWYWMPDYISGGTTRCGDNWKLNAGATDDPAWIKDCADTSDYGREVTAAHDHLWATSQKEKVANPNMDSVCVYKDGDGNAKWQAYASSNENDHACAQEKRFGIIAGSNAVMARSYCGLNKQLALMKSVHERSIAIATKLSNLEASDPEQELYIGGLWIEGGWAWDDGTPIENDASDWVGGAIPVGDELVFVCLVIPSCKLKACQSQSHDEPITRSILCENTHEDKPCPMSEYPPRLLKYGPGGGDTVSAGAVWPLPLRGAKYQGRCFYIGGHMDSCKVVCAGAVSKLSAEGHQIGGECDSAGLVKIKSKVACQMVVASFKLSSGTVDATTGRVGDGNHNGCIFEQLADKPPRVVVQLDEDVAAGTVGDPDCDSTPNTGQHRICACTTDLPDFVGALGVGDTISVSGLNSAATDLLERMEANDKAKEKKHKAATDKAKAKETLRQRAGHSDLQIYQGVEKKKGENLEGTLGKKDCMFCAPVSTTAWVPPDSVTPSPPADPLLETIKIELIDLSGTAGADAETESGPPTLTESGNTLTAFKSITFEADPAQQTVERCYHKVDDNGNDEGIVCAKSTIWPFDTGVGASAHAWSIDLRETLLTYEVFINGMRFGVLDFPRLPTDFPTGVQLTGVYGGHVARVPKGGGSQKYNYLPENGCVKYFHKIEGPVATWYFTMVSDDLSGVQAIHGIPGVFIQNPNIYFLNGGLRIVISDNGPREITFAYQFQSKRVYGIAIHYLKAEKVVELYINTKRVEYQYFTVATDLLFPEGLLGCTAYETSENKFLGKIWEFDIELKSPQFRPPRDECVNQHCQGPQWKQIEKYATSFCQGSICNHAIDEALCCEEMPLCKNEHSPFQCGLGSDWAAWADDTYCEDRLCVDGQSSLCCSPKDVCSIVDCGEWHVLVPDPDLIPCTSGSGGLCVAESETSVDFMLCCEPVQNCSTHVCKSGFTQMPHSLSTSCAGRQCGDVDDATCCAKKGMCTMLRCPGEMQHIPNASITACVDTTCAESSHEVCCMQEGRCDSIECPSPELSISAATTTYCAGLKCDRTPNSIDMQLCCEEPAPCSWYAEEWCGEDYVHKVFQLDNMSASCPGRVCREGEDKLNCCEQKAKCDNKTCPNAMRYLPNYLSILCDSITCHNTPDFKCCSEDSSCSTFNCAALGDYILKLNHSIEHCDDIVCKNSDLEKCCDEAPICDTSICPSSMVPHAEANLRYCQDRECSLNDKKRCCVDKQTCDHFDCADHDMLFRHDAARTLCMGSDCLTTDPEICCVVKGSCLSVQCNPNDGLIHKSNASAIICEGGDCGADAGQEGGKCCDKKEHCSEWTCPRRYNKKENADMLPCSDRYCSHADLHQCCQMEGWCINRTCPIGWMHRPDAFDTLCDDMACSESVTPEEKCCAERGRCNAMTCPHKYLPKLNASNIDCSNFACTEDDVMICCDNATECSHHECGVGMTLRGDHADHVCHNRQCGGEDHDICCVALGSCQALECPQGMLHIMNQNLLCTDEFCNATDPTVCCEHKGLCVTYDCPDGFVHKDPPNLQDCLGGSCSAHDRDRCCDSRGYCNDDTFQCPDGMTPKAHHQDFFCPDRECTTHDRLTCCTFSDRCDSMQCPPGFLHRHDAYEISCKGENCNKDEDHELCCVKEGNCFSWKCPEDYVHRDNATKIFCEDWKCLESVDLDTCCLHRAECNELQCKPESHDRLVNRWDSIDHLCVNKTCFFTDERDEEMCCQVAHMCSTFECSDGLSHRHDANNISCSDKNCTDTDEDLCCASKDLCHTYVCPKAYVHVDDSDTMECEGFVCDETDRDTCCKHVQWCNAMICPIGHANKVDAAGRLCASDKCTEEEDLEQCCDTTHTCAENKICDPGWTLRMDAHSRPCGDVMCLDTDNAFCCEEKPHCFSDLACPTEWVQKEPIAGRTLRCESGHRNAAGELICVEEDMKDICCTPIEHCDQYAPPLGFYLKPDGWNTSCVSWKCTDVDLHVCAGEAGYCGNYSCSQGYVHKHDAHLIMCQDLDCDATSEDVCCVQEGHCLSVKCDVDHIHRPITNDQPACLEEVCDPSVDHVRCCHQAPTCDGFLCSGQFSSRHNAENLSCVHHPETQSCNDEDLHECCVENGMCSTYPCGDAMLHRHDAHEVMCHDENCASTNETQCCAMMGFCPSFTCPPHMVHKNNSETTECRDDLCTDADKYYCCDVRATCENFKCPAGKVWKDAANMGSLLCAGETCENPRDDENCCKMSTEDTCTSAADCDYTSAAFPSACVNGENNFVSQCASGDPFADGMRSNKNGKGAIEGECFQKKDGDFACTNQPCQYVPPGAGAGEWCCNGDLFRSCTAKSVVDGTWVADVTGGLDPLDAEKTYEEVTTTTVNGAAEASPGIEAGARRSCIGFGLSENAKVATLFFGGLLALLPIATHIA